MKEKKQLTERAYIGEGYYHKFSNPKTGEEKYVEITKEDYEKMGLEGGAKYNPIPEEGWVHDCSIGGTLKVDSPTNFLGENEFTIKDNEYYAFVKHPKLEELFMEKHAEVDFNEKYTKWQ